MAYEPPQNDAVDFTLESYDQPTNDNVDFVMGEPDEEEPPESPDKEPFRIGTDAIEFPLSLDLPLQPLNLRNMQTGVALFMIGMLSVLGGAAAFLRNYVAGAVLGLAVVSLLLSGTLGVSLAPFWALLIATVIVLIFGALLRVMAT